MTREDILGVLEAHPTCAFSAEGVVRYLGEPPEGEFFQEALGILRELVEEEKVVYLGRGHQKFSHMFSLKEG